MSKIWRYFSIGLLIISNLTVHPVGAVTELPRCDDVKFIFARGSGESLRDKSEIAWRKSLQEVLAPTDIEFGFYELGQAAYGGAKYPAATVAGPKGFSTFLGAYAGAGEAFKFGASVKAGRTELKAYIDAISELCPQTKFVLGGYSQGAMVMSTSLPALDPDKIIYVATFGDPKLYLPEGQGSVPAACTGNNLSDYRAHVSNCRTYEGVLGGIHPYEMSAYQGKIGSWCHDNDIMCSSGLSFDDHGKYPYGGYQEASKQIFLKVTAAITGTKATYPTFTVPASTDVALLLNTSCYGELGTRERYRLEALRIAQQTLAQGNRVALYTYSDLALANPQLVCDFDSCTAEKLERILTAPATCRSATKVDATFSTLRVLTRDLSWRENIQKAVVILSPVAYDETDRDGTTLADVIQLSQINGLRLFAITNDAPLLQHYTTLTNRTGGRTYITNRRFNTTTPQLAETPAAYFPLQTYYGLVGQTINFKLVTPSVTDQDIHLHYDWDLDGDGIFEKQNAGRQLQQTFSATQNHAIAVRVRDSIKGTIYTIKTHIMITETWPVLARIFSGHVRTDTPGRYFLEFSSIADRILVAIDDAILGYIQPTTDAPVRQTRRSAISATTALNLPTSTTTNDSEQKSYQLTITDATPATKVRLIPYLNGVRGEAIEVTLGEDAEFSATAPIEPNNPENPTEPVQPENPVKPDVPENPALPDTPESPDTPTEPESPESSAHPTIPAVVIDQILNDPRPAAQKAVLKITQKQLPGVPNTGVAPR